MFDRKLFTYDEENHLGYYDGKLVPSVTQLVDIMFPYDEDIPQERLDNAATRGTKIHGGVETINTYFDNPYSFEENLQEAIDEVQETNSQELIDYISLIATFKLRPFDYEEMVFLLDENDELICYGHYDLTCQALKDYDPLFIADRLYLFDIKTTSLFEKKKVDFQESIYATAYEQSSGNTIDNIFGIWLREGAKLIPLIRMTNNAVIKTCKQLKEVWNVRRKNSQDS